METHVKMTQAFNTKFNTSVSTPRVSPRVISGNINAKLITPQAAMEALKVVNMQGLRSLVINELTTVKPNGQAGVFIIDMRKNVVQYQQRLFNKTKGTINTQGSRVVNRARIDFIDRVQHETIQTPIGEVRVADGVEKYWIHGHTGTPVKPRQEHVAADGQAANEDGYFKIAGELVEAPGDFSDESQNYNCHCAVGLRLRSN